MRRSPRPRKDATSTSLVFGINPVIELLRASPASIERLWVVPDAAGSRVREESTRVGVAVEAIDRAGLDRLTDGGHHQGVAAQTRPFAYADIETLLEAGPPLLVALDGITDPQNLGAIVRTAEVLGAGGLIVPRDRNAPVTAAAIRASSGATAYLPIAQVVNLVRALATAKERGYWIVGLSLTGTSTFQALPPLERALLVVGSEGKGARPLVLDACDFLVRIPGRGRVQSLNAAVAAAIGLYALSERVPAPSPHRGDC
jgi:23S rRNA (guanosine2251-2'-O)-methyltransferase